ncbi:30S ribosomal protein THX [Chryseobacterium carnipullorum]|uniref:30S ribosomal protein Thx n=2 Tax=Chryseobacterium TaxID=59732 RepID=A0A1M7B7S3_CHRCU|nr:MULTISPECIES: 30S ribosomal protein THX [Chryseobacterium]MDN5395912.1 30S ribosomal protein THX [Chryseobacterium sp.]AZA48350.1 30S ribosomal protein THX [Chryseobacterium carnipullorum]AZA63283.1 30S ribosomal protein THX [Chryseobacterium carnipullorum]MDN5423973.1 30S ribosomal protein THX [Chryseobacterium sp.]MDN5477807.1 30S ribosomal protein THX [Chryseobacterium sp.]
MGKGDRKSRRGKINSGSYGKRRPRKASKSIGPSETKAKS